MCRARLEKFESGSAAASQRRALHSDEQQHEGSIIEQNRTSSVELVKNRTRVLFINSANQLCHRSNQPDDCNVEEQTAEVRECCRRSARGAEWPEERKEGPVAPTRESYEHTLSISFPLSINHALDK